MKYSHVYFEDRYTLSENSYLMAADGDMATMMCLSNGYMGVRGSLEEDGTLGVQGTYIRGVIDTAPCAPMPVIDNEYMKKYYFNEEAIKRFEKNDAFINNADILLLRFSVNGSGSTQAIVCTMHIYRQRRLDRPQILLFLVVQSHLPVRIYREWFCRQPHRMKQW